MTCKNNLFLKKRKAFTLIELLIVIAIIGILFIVLVSKVDFATDKAKATGVQTDFRSFQLAIETVAKENAGLATFGWDTGDINGNRIRDSYDKGDTNQNGKQDPGEVFVGSKTYGETWTNVYTLTNPADPDDKSAIAALEEAINKNLDPKLHITIHDDLTITMANSAQDPWKTEYHGVYLTNATTDGKDRGAIVLYSNGANQEWGSEHSISNGIVTINVPGNNVYGKDDYGIAVVYTYFNGYGEVKTQTSGFSQNQDVTNNSNNSNNSSNGGNVGDLNNAPVIGDTKQFATLITSSTLKDIYDLSTSPDKEYGQAAILMNNETHLSIALLDETTYTIYYEFYNASEDYWYSFSYATEGIVELGYVPEAGWYMFDDDSGEPIKSNAPYITFVQDMETSMPNGISDLATLFVNHAHSYVNCKCNCGKISHNIVNNNCTNCGLAPGLYASGSQYTELIYSWQDLIDMGIINSNGGTCEKDEYGDYMGYDNSLAVETLQGDLWIYSDNGIIPDYAFYRCEYITGIKLPNNITSIGNSAFKGVREINKIEFNEGLISIGDDAFDGIIFNCDLRLPKSLQTIGSYAFGEIYVHNLYIGSNIKTIGNAAFFRYEIMGNIYLDSLDAWYNIEFGPSNFSNPMYCGNSVYVNGVLLEDLVIPEYITNIGRNQFYGLTITGKLVFNSHITFDNIDPTAFQRMYNVTSIEFNDVMTYIPDNAFDGFDSIIEIEFPSNIVEFGDDIFGWNESIKTITIHGDSDYLNDAFADCRALETVIFTSNITKLKCGTCDGCRYNYSCYNTDFGISQFVDKNKFKIIVPNEYKNQYINRYSRLSSYIVGQ